MVCCCVQLLSLVSLLQALVACCVTEARTYECVALQGAQFGDCNIDMLGGMLWLLCSWCSHLLCRLVSWG